MTRLLTQPRLWQGIVLLLLGFIAGTVLLARQPPPLARAQEEAPAPAVIAPGAAEAWHTCSPREVSVWDNRIHVQCFESVGGIVYFATATADAARAARILSTLTAAQLSGRQLLIFYEATDTSGEGFGCNPVDCRRIIGVSLQ